MAIKPLNPETATQIAAGEVVESPVSVVKELVENALDAGATRITIRVREGGCASVSVVDNGTGIAPEELVLAFRRHATSKIEQLEDLWRITTLGFRGEALPSIAAVSRVTLTTRCRGELRAWRILLEGGRILGREMTGAPTGTVVTVDDLFFNTPARHKFLRSPAVELGRISTLVAGLALARPDVSFTLESGGKCMLKTRGDGSLSGVVALLYGDRCAAALLPFQRREERQEKGEGEAGLTAAGLLSAPYHTRASRRFMTVIVNGRTVKAPALAYALERGYGELLPRRRHPVAVLHLEVPPRNLDINVHPAKTEVRFQSNERVNNFVYQAVRQALSQNIAAPLAPPAGKPLVRAEYNPDNSMAALQQPAPEAPAAQILFTPDTTASVPPVVKVPAREFSLSSGTAAESSAGTPCLIGQLWRSYLLATEGENLFLLDQHAAHERVIYHALCGSDMPPLKATQLTVPVVIELPLPWRERFKEMLAVLEKTGFILEPFGDTSCIVREIPFSPFTDHNGTFLEKLFAELLAEEPPPGSPSREAVLKTVACHRAVKAGQALNRTEMEMLLARWALTPEREYCPHGRPAVLQFTRGELEKKFHRR